MPERPCGEGQAVFEVALWRWWPSLFPDYVASVAAPDAFAAIEQGMRVARVCFVARAAAIARDGSLCYRALGVRLGGGTHDGGSCS
jgi:purine nucleoside phosphorylase